jgi:hypothetical protein
MEGHQKMSGKAVQTSRNILAALGIAVLLSISADISTVHAADHTAPPLHAATEYPCYETHADEHVTIAVDPVDTNDKQKFLRFDYLSVGFLPVRLIVQNDSDATLDLNEARILFLTADGDHINAATLDDLDRAGGTLKMHPPGSLNPLPIPFPTKPSDKHIKAIQQDYDQFSYSAALVAPHSTAAGYLFYDVSGLPKPALRDAQMYIRLIRVADNQGNMKELFNFNIPFNKYLRMQ